MSQAIRVESRDTRAVLDPAQVSFDQFLVWPGENQHVEWVNGEVVPMSPVTEPHEDISGFLYSLLRLFAEGHRLGRVYSEPFVMKTGPDLPGRCPDVLFIAKKHQARVKRLYVEGPADLVVEVISPGSRTIDRGKKFHEYEQGGVPEYWLIDPERKRVEFYQRDQDGIYRAVPAGADGSYRSRALPGLWLKVGWLWQRPPLLSVLAEWKLV
ncbi:MAG TPA: Uma2 family endonuclease [Dongiaceae bacterium]|nr:Uma2 family endonuclease [Dongiaceae bacterium]